MCTDKHIHKHRDPGAHRLHVESHTETPSTPPHTHIHTHHGPTAYKPPKSIRLPVRSLSMTQEVGEQGTEKGEVKLDFQEVIALCSHPESFANC